LESQLADQKNVAQPEQVEDRSASTPEDVHNLAFSSATGGRRGYHEHEVDAFQTFTALGEGALTAARSVKDGMVQIRGDRKLLTKFFQVFRLPRRAAA
jgi:DivIVA domain-containing protein